MVAAPTVVALVGALPQEIIDHVAMGTVDGDAIKAHVHCPSRAPGKGLDDIDHLFVGHWPAGFLRDVGQVIRRDHSGLVERPPDAGGPDAGDFGVRPGSHLAHDALVP